MDASTIGAHLELDQIKELPQNPMELSWKPAFEKRLHSSVKVKFMCTWNLLPTYTDSKIKE